MTDDGLLGPSPYQEPDDAPDPEADGAGYQPTRVQKGAALVVAAGLVVLIAGTVVSLAAGGCVLDRASYYGDCASLAREPWFGLTVLITVGAAVVGSALGVRDLTTGRGRR